MERYQRALVGIFASVSLVTLSSRAHCDEASAFAKAAALEAKVPVERAVHVEAAIRDATEDVPELRPLLMAIAIRESNLLLEVETCDKRGDGGRALGLFQEHARGKTRDDICQGGARVQARVALAHLMSCGLRDDERMACYAGRKVTHRIVSDRLALAARLARAK